MARNEEKQYGRLNRLYLLKEKEEYEKNNPKRPRLDLLDTVEEVQKWLPSIKSDIDFYLKKSQVTCYTDAHVDECREKILKLEREFKAFVCKIKQLSPVPVETIPWTSRPYKRKISEAVNENLNEEFKPIPTPILDGKMDSCEINSGKIDVNLPSMDLPLSFSSTAENNELNVFRLPPKNLDINHSINLSDRLKYSNIADTLSRTSEKEKNDKNNEKTELNVIIVNYDSSDSETNEAV